MKKLVAIFVLIATVSTLFSCGGGEGENQPIGSEEQALIYTETTVNELHTAIQRQPLKYDNINIQLEGYALGATLNSFYLCFPIPTKEIDLSGNGKKEQFKKTEALDNAKASNNAILVEYDLTEDTVRVLDGDYVLVSARLTVKIVDGKEIKIDLYDVVCEIKETPKLEK